jgi:hypothetical protein
MDEPLGQPLQGWIEVLGVAKDSSTFVCHEIICFENNENDEPFNDEEHNALVTCLDLIKDSDLYKFSN